jgi:TolB-like protein
VKVLDLGLAKRTSVSASALTLTQDALSETGLIGGTVPYMAPEQILAEQVGARTDLFAFGVLLYELLSGRRPFAGSSAILVSLAILNEPPEPLPRLRSDLTPQFAQIVAQCLEKNPLKRPPSALGVANELRRIRRSLEHGEARDRDTDQVASIAVLPFVNRSRDEEDEYFSDGLADELLNVLAKIRGLRVAARTSAFHFKGKDTTIAEVGSVLRVATVLEGTVRKAGNRVRISVQLGGWAPVADSYGRAREAVERALALEPDLAEGHAAMGWIRGSHDWTGGARKPPMRARWSWRPEMLRWWRRPVCWHGAWVASRTRFRCAAARWSWIR